ncbi:MAG: 2Fe-2S iron-sulfur cluster binding domain-containing protein [Acidobacteria bacterium]|nr:MAG: 2Fe-2S iron-sulfur cluster binding domain-containing protein [Acidobacteriota bacterium]
METVTLTIDGKPVTVEKGKSVLEAVIQSGGHVPYYCYHPGLGVDGSCRVCIVKIEKMPKLQTSCSTPCGEGMVVTTNSPDVEAARASVFEFLLVNHPLDCPVCDKGGECPLQDFSYSYGPERSRMEFERRTFDGEGVKADIDFGPTLMLNRNRCILCTRCVRFMKEVDGDAQIGITHRGVHSEISTFEEKGVVSLLSGNLMDVCPVGALTTRDYRFKSRPWDNPQAVDTICTLCEKGCNTTAWIKAKPEWAKGSQLIRTTPRLNEEINSYWMCDIGRFDYHWIESDRRVNQPHMNAEVTTWENALVAVNDAVGAVGGAKHAQFLVSGHASLEELFVLKQFAGNTGGVTFSWRHREKPQPMATKFRIPAVDAPNLRGAKDLGFTTATEGPANVSSLKGAVDAGLVKLLYVLDPGPDGTLGDVDWVIAARKSGKIQTLIVQGVLHSPLSAAADILLPGCAFIEKDAAYTNMTGHVQGAARAITPPGDAVEDWQILAKLSVVFGGNVAFTSSAAVRQAIADALASTPGYAALATMTFSRPVSAKSWLQASNPSERWKWDFMFQDLPPIKFGEDFGPMPRADVIPIKEVK